MRDASITIGEKTYVTHTTLSHKHSAVRTFTKNQIFFFVLVLGLFFVGFFLNSLTTAIIFISFLSLVYFIDVLFTTYVLMKSLHNPPDIHVPDFVLDKIREESLPMYTILCPLYKESIILPHFVSSIKKLDWPKHKLEVLLLLEEDDKETIQTAQNMNLPSHFKILVVPHSLPKTKPKACNYGLAHATGQYAVIYDAEDQPELTQLKKVYTAFQVLGPEYGCIQCKLNYFNPNHNLLTRLFTAEYSLWFDVILPGLQSIEGVIPLGGTSNHFRTEDLIAFEAWDPFNVTEDCDLGVRLFKAGRKTAIVDSVTLEEANSNVKNWIRQRSRWIKGYFQTYLVHMRNPLHLFRQHKIHAFIFQLVIGMRMTFMLINPLLWLMTFSYFALNAYVGSIIEALFPPLVFYMAGFALIVGNFLYLYNYMIGCAKRGHWDLIKFIFFIPFYWLIMSYAALIALWQLITKPHYWEKTHHGLHLSPASTHAPESTPQNSVTPSFVGQPVT
jgi:glycosyltransferase XagB